MRNTLFVLALTILAACGDDADQSSEQHLARAREFVAALAYNAAEIELKNALQLDGKSAEARWLLGSVYLERNEILSAEKELQQAQKLGWKANDVRPMMARVRLAQAKFSDVLDLEYKDLSLAAASRLLTTQANAALSDGQVEEAEQRVAIALDKDPASLEARLAEARIFAFRGDAADALLVIEALLQEKPEYAKAWSIKGRILQQQMKLEDARTAFDQAIAHSQLAYPDRVSRALLNIELQDYEAAGADAAELMQFVPAYPAGNYVQGLLYVQNKQYRNAITVLLRASPAAGQYPLILYYLSMVYLFEGEEDLAAKSARAFVKLEPGSIPGRKLLAFLLLLQKQSGDAQEVLQPVLDNNPDDVEALQIMANALLLDGKDSLAFFKFARVAHLQPDAPVGRLSLASGPITSATDESSGLRQELLSGLDNETDLPRRDDLLLILTHIRNKDMQGAIEAAESYKWRNLEGVAPYNLLGQVYLAAGQTADAKETFEKALAREPADTHVNLSLAGLALEAGDRVAARQYYLAVLGAHPSDLLTLLQLAALEQSERHKMAMVARLNEALEAHPSALEPRLALARFYIGSGRPNKVAPLFATLNKLQQDALLALELTALAQIALQQNEAARSTLEQLISTHSASAFHYYLLAIEVSDTGDQQKAKQLLMEAIKLDANYLPSLLSLARIAVAEGDDAKFGQYLATAVALAPDAPDVLRLRALDAQRNDNLPEAAALSARALAKAPAQQTLLELAYYQEAAGQLDMARNTLQQWIKDNFSDIRARLNLAKLLQRENDFSGANEQYHAVLELDAYNIIALNNLAWNLRQTNPTKALEYIHRAASAAPDQLDVQDTLVTIERILAER